MAYFGRWDIRSTGFTIHIPGNSSFLPEFILLWWVFSSIPSGFYWWRQRSDVIVLSKSSQMLLNPIAPPPLIITFSLPCLGLGSDSENAEQKFFFENAIARLFFKTSSSIWFHFSCHWLNFRLNDQKHPKMYLYRKYIEWSASKSESFVRRVQTKLSLKSE